VPGIITYNPIKIIKFLSGFAKLPNDLVVYTRIDNLSDNVIEIMNNSNICFKSISG